MVKARLKWQADQVMNYLQTQFAQAFKPGRELMIDAMSPTSCTVHLVAGEADLRPGGTVSGPALMELVDFTVYALLIGLHGESALLAVTTNLNISFLRKPGPGKIVCKAELLKHGRTLSVADCRIVTGNPGEEVLVAHAEATYFIGNSG